ncbi:MAG: hypothetical protein JKY44_03650 [Flavobacteriaceae bacterium]|nr:hypothetical protein [Flavobacteriaceae bacterium]
MNKTCNILILLLILTISCVKSEKKNITSNEDIYEFMKVVIKEQNLNLSYGISIKPESDFDITKSDNENFKSLKTNLDSVEQKSDSLNWSVNLNSLTLLSNLSKEDISEMISQKESSKTFEWNNARLGFNLSNKNNWYSFSVPLFSKDKNKAVMMIRNLCPGLCGEGKTILFIKKDGKWTSNLGMQWLH